MHEVNFELVGERIKLKRKAKKLTQDAVAEICGCSSKHLSAVENGEKPSIELLMKLSVVLDATVDYFLKDSPLVAPSYLKSEIGKKIAICDTVQLKAVDKAVDSILAIKEEYLLKGIPEV
ncbi:helix-turn-helix domain-containing protein [Faecalicatena contorta]|uniref:helix-turn-helix domain-containing protein n=1 Tax=Faecalicatena contorta TaxID=39482 RepID=UPI00189ACC30|nr:helix-turn-helix transcriptional regulator [Faecalicatena contorta]